MAGKKDKPKYSNQVSVGTFIFYSIISFGIYELVWFYRSWKFFKEKEKTNISPFWRTVFAIFFINSLFKKMLEYAKKEGYKKEYSSIMRVWGWFIINMMARLPDPFWLISSFSFLFLLSPLNAMNYYLNKTEKKCQPRTKEWWHILLIVFCITWWILIILSFMIPEA
jgi:hypothetical protein